MQDSVYHNRWRSLLFVGVSLLVISLDNTILNVALPSISRQLGASASDLQWIVDAYVLVFAALLLTMGSIGDRVGRKRALQFGVILFGIGSFFAAISNSTAMLIASRAFLGIGGATIMPATLSIVTATFRDPKERAQAIAIWAAIFGLGVGLGPLIGGWLLERFTWNAVFFVNLPVVVIALIGGYLYIADSKDEHAPTPDIPGVLLSITGLFALVYAIIEAGLVGWTAPNVLIAFAIAAVLLTIFAWWENRAPNAMLPLRFFRNMSFTGANIALAMATFSMFGSMFFMSQFFQSVQGYSTLEAGSRVLPMAVVLIFASSMSARVSQRLGIKLSVSLGLLLAALGLFIISRVVSIDAPYTSVLVGLVVLGAGLGISMSPATSSVMGSVPVSKAGVGSAMNDTTRQLGGALGIAVLGTVMNNIYLRETADLFINPGIMILPEQMRDTINSSIQGAHIIANMLPFEPLKQEIISVTSQAFVDGMRTAVTTGSIIMLGAVIVTLVLLPAQVRRSIEDDEVLPVEAVAVTGD